MLLFRSEDDINRWCATTGNNRGEAVPLQQIWLLSKLWYARRMHPDFRGRSPEQAPGIFAQAGLTSEFWRA